MLVLSFMVAAVCNTFVRSLLAHGGEPHDLHDLWRSWAFDEPVVIAGLLITAWVYTRGVRRLWRASRTGGGIRRWEAACFAGGWLALVVALVSPLHPWGRVLFSAHMTQHEVLMLVAAPLLVLGKPLVATLKAMPARWAHGLAEASNAPAWKAFWGTVTNALAAKLWRVNPSPNQDQEKSFTAPAWNTCTNAAIRTNVRITSSTPVITSCTLLVISIPMIRTSATTTNHRLATEAVTTTLPASAGSMKFNVAVAAGMLPVTMKTRAAIKSAQPEKNPRNFPNAAVVH